MAIDFSKYGTPVTKTSSGVDFSKYGTPVSDNQVQPTENKGGNFIKNLVSAPATLLARPIQAVAELGGISDQTVNDVTKKLTGGLVAPTPQNFSDVKKDVGRGAETVALGLGPVSGGATFGLGNSLEQGNDLISTQTAFQTVLGATGGKVLDLVGKPLLDATGKIIGKITPQVLKDVASKGTNAIQKFAENHNILPKNISRVINTGAEKIDQLANKPFDLANVAVKNLTAQSEKQIEQNILSKYEKGVKPLINAKMTPGKLSKYRDDVITAVKTIKENKTNLSFNDESGLISGESPKTLQQLADSVEQTKKSIFNKYDSLAKQAGEAGINVKVSPIAKELDSVIGNKALKITNPKAIKYAQDLQSRLNKTGKLDASTAQEVIQNYNKSLEAFYRNPSYDNASNAAIDAMVANNMRKSLDEGITGLTGKQYQTLKNQYGSLKSIEKDVIKASLRDARKNTKGLIDFTDIFSGGQIVNGLLSLNPGQVGAGLTQKGIATFYKYLNNPNRAIEKLFTTAEKLPSLSEIASKNFQRDASLTGADAKLQEASISKYLGNKETLLKDYLKDNGNIVNTDEARKQFKDIGYNGANSPAVQEASSALAKDAWRHLLKTSKEPDVLLYAGGSGTGKTSAVKTIIPDQVKGAGAILDGNLSTMKSADARIKEAIDAGKTPTVVYVYRDPVESWVNGVIKRMVKNQSEKGRVVPLSIFLDNHKGSYNVVKNLLEKGDVNIDLIDNSLGGGKQNLMSQEKFDNIKYPSNLKETLLEKTKQIYEQGKITKEQYEALIK